MGLLEGNLCSDPASAPGLRSRRGNNDGSFGITIHVRNSRQRRQQRRSAPGTILEEDPTDAMAAGEEGDHDSGVCRG
jgi:hypothetical protein